MIVAVEKRSLFLDFASGIAFYSIPVLVRAAASFLTVPVYTRFLTPTDYGTLELLDLTGFLVGVLIGTNFGHAVFYYYAAAKNDEDRSRAISTVFFGSLLLGAFAGGIGMLLPGVISQALFGNASYVIYIRVLFMTLAVAFPAEVGLSCIRVLNRHRTYAIVSVTRLLTGVAANIVLLTVYKMGFAAMLWGSFIVTAGTAAYMFWLCAPSFRVSPDRHLFWAMLRYSWPLNISALAMLILDLGDRYVLKRTVSLADLGIYGLAYKLGMIVGTVSLIFNQFWKPKMFTLMREENGERTYVRICTYYALALTFVCMGLSLLLCPLIQVIVGRGFVSVATYIPAIAVIYLIRMMGDFFRNAFYLNKRTGKDAQITWLGTAVCVTAYLTLIPWLRLWGAILATGISFALMLAVSFWQAQKVQHFPFEIRRLVLIPGTGIALIALYVKIEPAPMHSRLMLGITFILVYPAILLLLGLVHPDEKAAVQHGIAMVRDWIASRRKPLQAS
jgi:O-antigen/teichoic acid export membrane protein